LAASTCDSSPQNVGFLRKYHRDEPGGSPGNPLSLLSDAAGLQLVLPIADKASMSMINEIAAFSTAMSTAQVQSAVATKVLKMANNQAGEVVSRLLDSAMENMQATMQNFAGDLGNNVDETA
jgi:hypothetical protein